jgi:hypothetical protein
LNDLKILKDKASWSEDSCRGRGLQKYRLVDSRVKVLTPRTTEKIIARTQQRRIYREHVVEVLHFIYVKRDDNFSMRKYLYETRVVKILGRRQKRSPKIATMDSEKRNHPLFGDDYLFLMLHTRR